MHFTLYELYHVKVILINFKCKIHEYKYKYYINKIAKKKLNTPAVQNEDE